MAIRIKTSTPKKLLGAYKKAIDDGHVKTWSYDSDGDFTHTADQWTHRAWLRPKIVEGQELTFYILGPKGQQINVLTYAIYHGRFIESMLGHCDNLFDEAHASALPQSGDWIGEL
jgi:hypothetical protein